MNDKKISAIIVDDEQEARDILENLIKDFEEIELISKESNVDDAVKAIIDKTPDIIFLDIEMPGKDGFVLIDEIRNIDLNPTIIFITAFNRAVEAFDQAVFDYLMKPIEPGRLRKTINRYKLEKHNYNLADKIEKLKEVLNPVKIKFTTKAGFLFINPEDIVCCEADGNYSHLHLSNGRKELVTRQLGQIESILPDNTFFKISRSVIINTNFLSSVNKKSKKVILLNGIQEIELAISKERLKVLGKISV